MNYGSSHRLASAKLFTIFLFFLVSFAGVAQNHSTFMDFDGDGRADLAARRASTSEFLIRLSEKYSGQNEIISFGESTDIPISGDFDGDGITDIGVRRAANQTWYIINSSGVDYISGNADGITRYVFGRHFNDIPVPADYDGDGRTDIAVRRPSTQYWYILNSSGVDTLTGHSDGISRKVFGRQATDIPVPADYDGDGKADIAVRRPVSHYWYIFNSSGIDNVTLNQDGITRKRFGLDQNDIPVPADYDGDGKTDIAVRRPATFTWYILNSSGVDELSGMADGISRYKFGMNRTDIPVPADYDGDGKADLAVKRLAEDFWLIKWYILNSSGDDPIDSYDDGISRVYFSKDNGDVLLAQSPGVLWFSSDLDGDGLNNRQEMAFDSNILETDTDGDGVSDFDEVYMHDTDPNNPDSDGDGVSDYLELVAETDPNDPSSVAMLIEDVSFTDSALQQCVNDTQEILVSEINYLTCKSKGITDISGLEAFTSLEELRLYDNQIEDLTPISELLSIQILVLSANPIHDLAPLGNLTQLTELYLSWINATDISFLTNLDSLSRLSFSGNTGVDLTPIASLTQLKDLFLEGNQIEDISFLENLAQLERLNLDTNSIADISVLSRLQKLHNLSLNNNQVVDLNPLSNLIKLSKLKLANNQISDFSPLETLGVYWNLQYLSLNGNLSGDISFLRSFAIFDSLSLENNGISDLSPLAGLTQVNTLNLGDNQISSLEPLTNLDSIRYLNLDKNQVSDLSALQFLKRLKQLNLSDNDVEDISPLTTLTGLWALDLSNNQLADITAITALQQLRELYLQHNLISDVSGIFHLISLTELSLLGNSQIPCNDLTMLSDTLPEANIVHPLECVP